MIDNVVSLFDGMSCGQIALNKSNIKFNNYYSSEIDKSAIKVSNKNFPNTIQLGDVSNWKSWNLDKIDLLIGGSPCEGFSSSGKGLNFDDPRSKLFFDFVDVLNYYKPKYFLLENVNMRKEWKNIISEKLNVEPIEIDSSLVSAQKRVRLYWTNIPNVELPEDRNIKLNDILEDKSFPNKATIVGRRLNENGKRDDYNKKIPITQCLEVRATNRDKSNCLTTASKDNVLTPLPIGRYPDAFKRKLPFRYYTTKEMCRLQTVPENYFGDVVSETEQRRMLGKGWTVDVIAHIFSYL